MVAQVRKPPALKCCGKARANMKVAALTKAVAKAQQAKTDANKHVWDPKTQTHTNPKAHKKATAKKHPPVKKAAPCKLCGAAAKRAARIRAVKK